jgi:hypothetical protein
MFDQIKTELTPRIANAIKDKHYDGNELSDLSTSAGVLGATLITFSRGYDLSQATLHFMDTTEIMHNKQPSATRGILLATSNILVPTVAKFMLKERSIGHNIHDLYQLALENMKKTIYTSDDEQTRFFNALCWDKFIAKGF